MKFNSLSTAICLAILPTTSVFAAAIDRSGQSVAAFLQPNNYFEAGISVLDPNVSGQEAGVSPTRRNIENMASNYYFPSASLKFQVNPNFSFGILYDQPFGAKAAYKGVNEFVASPNDRLLSSIPGLTNGAIGANVTGNTNVEVDTNNISLLFGYQPNNNINLYAGGVYQTIRGHVNLRGSAYSLYNGYEANIKETGGGGWIVGAAYQIPDIALKTSLTYRSEIKHNVDADEHVAMADRLASLSPSQLQGLLSQLGPAGATVGGVLQKALAANAQSGKTEIKTPQSVNFDFQTGIMKDTIAFANMRWVNWKDFAIQPYKFGAISHAVGPLVGRPDGFNLVKYSKDQWSINTGLGRKLSEKWAGNVSVGWDSGAGDPVTTLGPTKGYWNVGLGAQFSPAPNYFIAGGVKYFWLGDAKAQSGAQAGGDQYLAEFTDNHSLAYGLKIGYRF